MGFWRKIWKGAVVAGKVGRTIAPIVAHGTPIVGAVFTAVDEVAKVCPQAHEAKKDLAVQMALGILKMGEAAAGRELYDEEKLAKALGPMIQAVMDFREAQKNG